jgi:predicted PurR-regulated permease PerM
MTQIGGKTRTILLIAGGLFLIFLLWYFSAIVTYILISVFFSFLGRPLVNWLTRIRYRRFHIPKGIAALIALVAIWALFFTFFRFMVPLLLNEFETLSNVDFEVVLQSIEEPLNKLFKFFGHEQFIIENRTLTDIIIDRLGSKINFSQLPDIFALVAGTVGEFFIGVFSVSFITFFFLKEKNMFREGVLLIVPTEIEAKVSNILDSISYLLRRYFIGIILEVFMVGLLDTLGLTIIGVEFNHAVVIGLFCGLFNVIPYLGPWMGSIAGLIIGLALHFNADFMGYTLPLLGLMAIVFITVQVVDNVLFQPFIYSSSVKSHPLEIFLVIMTAGSLAGVLGMFLAIPVYTIIRVIAKEFFVNMKLVRKLTESLNKEDNNNKKH